MGTRQRAERLRLTAGRGGLRLGRALVCLALAVLAGGCAQNEIGRYGWSNWIIKDPQRVRNQIVKSEDYWIQREVEPEEAFPGPTPEDLAPPETDYILGPGDLIDITIHELMVPNQPFVSRQRITQSGQIALPYIGSVKAAGLTVRGLEEKLADVLEPDYLIDPQVTVFVVEFRNLTVTVLSGVFRPGNYPLVKQDTTLLQVLALAGGVVRLVQDYGYVIRRYAPEEADMLMLETGLPAEEAAAEEGGMPEEEARAAPPEEGAGPGAGPGGEGPAPGASDRDRDLLQDMAEGRMPHIREIEEAEAAAAPAPPPEAPPVAPPGDEGEVGRWIWDDGQWVEVRAPEPPEPAPAVGPAEPEEVPEPEEAVPEPVLAARLELERKLMRLGVVQGSGQLRRIIRFDVEALLSGDVTQNVVLRNGDVVMIPSPPAGDFYMAGQVNRPGVYSLTGRKLTLLQAVAAAGGLTAVAVPWRTEVVRRLSEDEEEIIYVDLAKVARGDVPDFYVQPEDLIRVGTDQRAIYDAVLRNAFRATYGVGAVYDTNFADFYPWTDAVYPLFPGLH